MSETKNNDMLFYQIRQGSTQAFDEFYYRYYPFVMHVCRSFLYDYMEAEEICHDVFLEVIKRAELYDETKGTIEAWLTIIAKSKSKDLIRKKQRRASIANLCLNKRDTDPSVFQTFQAVDPIEYNDLHEAVKNLPSNQKRVVTETYFHNKTHNEVARQLNIPLGTVKSWVRYGVKNLRKQLSS